MFFRNFVVVCVLGMILTVFTTSSAEAEIRDSLRLEKSKNGEKAWIIHQVEPKETVYGLARRYNVSVKDIYNENPKAKKLKINDILRIPHKSYSPMLTSGKKVSKSTHTVITGETLYKIAKKYNVSMKDIQKWNKMGKKTDIRVGEELIITDQSGKKVNLSKKSLMTLHTVEEDEYLYLIAKKYKVKIAEIKEWNNLDTDRLKIGQKLKIYKKGYKVENTTDNTNNRNANVPNKVEPTIDSSTDNVSGYQKVIQKGFGELIPNDNSDKYIGLHKTAPIGTVVSVKNTSNGKSVFVRIIGRLPSIEANNKILIKVSRNVYESLKADGTRFPIEVSYLR